MKRFSSKLSTIPIR